MIAIVVVGYNSLQDLKDCFDSIEASTYKDYETIFVDNASTDLSVEFVKKNYPEIIVIENENSSYAGGNNIGIRKAIELKSDNIFILNPDTIVTPDCLEQLASRVHKNKILQPLILIYENGHKTSLINTTGNYLNFLGISYCNDYRKNQKTAKDMKIASASGAAMIFSSSMIKQVGGFDSNFFMYHEDLDLCVRAKLRGYETELISKAVVYHKYSFSQNKKKLFYVERNRLLFLFKNFPFKYLLLIFVAFLINELLIVLYSLLTGSVLNKVKSYASATSLLKKTNIERRKNKKYFKNVRNVTRFIGGQIAFSEVKNPLFAPYSLILSAWWFMIKWLV